MGKETKAKQGWFADSFTGSIWDSHIKSANTTKKELWLGYVFGTFGMALTSSIVNSYFNQYLTDILGFTISKGKWIAGFMVLFPVISKLIDAITNIIMGKLIDNTTCRQGKVRPWLIASTPLILISVMMLFSMPFQNVYLQAVWVIVAFNLYYSVAYTMWNMGKELLPALSTRNIRQRRNNSMASTITINIGTGFVSILFPLILTSVCAAVNGDSAKGYFLCMTIITCIAIPLTFMQYFYTKERVTEERRNQRGIVTEEKGQGKTQIRKEVSFKEQLKACLQSKYWVVFILLILAYQILINMRNISLVYYSGWIVHGNAYGEFASIQAKFQMIAMSPLGPGLLLVLPLMKRFGRRRCIWVGATFSVIGSVIAFVSAGYGTMIYAGSALAAIGGIPFTYMVFSYLGDVIDYVEWKQKVRCDGITSSFYGAMMMFSVGIAQGIFNLGLMLTGYTQPTAIGENAEGIMLYADQTAAASGWINVAYQGSYILLGLIMVVVFCAVFKLENELPAIAKELQERKVAKCKAFGIEYIPSDELERREIEEQERQAEEIRIRELRERCEKNGRDFDAENARFLEKQAKKKAKQKAKEARRAGRKV